METGNKVHKKDLRVQKTQKALFTVLFLMLDNRNFNEITVNDLCAQASVSRATFYTHFIDKYDLLKFFLTEIRESIIKDIYKYDELERAINSFVESNKRVIANVVRDANNETRMHIHGFMSCIAELMIQRRADDDACLQHLILRNFFSGGLVHLLFWMVENNFPTGVSMMNTYLYKMLKAMASWDAKQDKKAHDV